MLVNNGLLTKGLGVRLPACFSLITARFSVFVKIVQKTYGGGGGGGAIIPPSIFNGEDQSLLNHPIFIDEPRKVNNLLSLKIKFGDKIIEKEYIVPKNRLNFTIKIIDIINSTNKKTNIKIKNIRELKNKLFAKISKIKNYKL